MHNRGVSRKRTLVEVREMVSSRTPIMLIMSDFPAVQLKKTKVSASSVLSGLGPASSVLGRVTILTLVSRPHIVHSVGGALVIQRTAVV